MNYKPFLRKHKAVLIPVVALLVGIGLGGAGSDASAPTPAPVAAPQPAPTVTKTAPAPPARVVTEVPEACTDAIAEARKIMQSVSDFASAGEKLPPLIGKAYEAGVTGNQDLVDEVLATMEESNEGLSAANKTLGPQVQRFNGHAEGCE